MPSQSLTTIRNFGRVNANYYRGAQPRPDEYANLSRLGVKTVIDLCDKPEEYAQTQAHAAGLIYHPLPMSDKVYPSPDIAPAFLGLGTNASIQPIFVHCAGGRHRTGAMTAVYRMKIDHWNLEKAMHELESYDFGWLKWRWISHGEIKRFVKDYWAQLNHEEPAK